MYCMINCFFTLAYPAVCLLYVLYMWFSLFAADVRNTRAHQGDGGFAA